MLFHAYVGPTILRAYLQRIVQRVDGSVPELAHHGAALAGLNRLHNLWICTSRGTGYWGPETPRGVF